MVWAGKEILLSPVIDLEYLAEAYKRCGTKEPWSVVGERIFCVCQRRGRPGDAGQREQAFALVELLSPESHLSRLHMAG